MDDINLLPPDFIVGQRRRTRLRAWSGLVALICVGLVGSWCALHWHSTAAERQVASLRQQYTQVEQRLEQLKGLREQQQKLQARGKMHEALLHQTPWRQIFFDIAALTDEEIWLTQLQLRKMPVVGSTRATVPAPQQRPEPFFTSGKAALPVTGQPESLRETATTLLVQGYATSTPRLANFMSGLAAAPYLSKVDLQEARREIFLTREVIHFIIEIHL